MTVSDPQKRVVAFNAAKGTWGVANDPQPVADGSEGGSIWPPVGDALVKEYRVPVVFDNLIADRRRTALLFGFDYTIEIYVPAAKRKRGYYAMPVLAGDRLAGTVDPRFDRGSRHLIVNRIALEPGEKMTPAINRAIADLAKFVGAADVIVASPPRRGSPS